ncbi:enhanced serine sensitivity protein SseB C-terminal domain-containing protein [Massilia solisilvae]|uniref:Enhanced serine sensitivity protein SseB C-terminal domain-containing protein n=1 Tax=Massilia solisilvae TaxID=1811225 RepID=A0ABT2BJF0_9BURK|nr:enhanced serine sensitivity protein SseB C-terminal domain-containing protein [Massilia solisilvae]MCS0608631.1 enhanced serine sensitivity protein SseB C-terminal domain-containing protein [Massilia solisilvae]
MERLESALATAAADPAARPEFYRILLESEIYVLGSSNAPGEGGQTLPAGATLSLAQWKKADGTAVIPFFASMEALQRALKEPAQYLAMPARAFFEMTSGARLVINPASDYAKEFAPHEIAALLRTGVNSTLAVDEVHEPRKVLLGQPAEYPAAMVTALAKLMARHASVKGAYLCLMHDPSASDKPALVVGLEGEGDLVQVIQEAGSVAADTAPTGWPVNFVEIKRGQPGIARHMFTAVSPFYARKHADGVSAWLRTPAGRALCVFAIILGIVHHALFPQVPSAIAWPVIFCILMVCVLLATRGKRPTLPAERSPK